MAREPVVKIAGNAIEKILTVSYAISNGADKDGKPTKSRRCMGIQITRIADDSKTVSKWAESAVKAKRQKGSIEFQHPDGTKMKTLEWEEGYIQQYSVHYDKDTHHVVESFVIQPRKVTVEGKAVDYEWETDN